MIHTYDTSPMEVEMGGCSGLKASMPDLTGKDKSLVITLVLKSEEDNSYKTASRLNSELHMYPHTYTHTYK